MHCTIFPVYRSILKGKVARMLKKKIEHNLIDEHLKKKKTKKNLCQPFT